MSDDQIFAKGKAAHSPPNTLIHAGNQVCSILKHTVTRERDPVSGTSTPELSSPLNFVVNLKLHRRAT